VLAARGTPDGVKPSIETIRSMRSLQTSSCSYFRAVMRLWRTPGMKTRWFSR